MNTEDLTELHELLYHVEDLLRGSELSLEEAEEIQIRLNEIGFNMRMCIKPTRIGENSGERKQQR